MKVYQIEYDSPDVEETCYRVYKSEAKAVAKVHEYLNEALRDLRAGGETVLADTRTDSNGFPLFVVRTPDGEELEWWRVVSREIQE